MQTYRSGHNVADSKSVCGQPHVGSNPTVCVLKSLGNKLFPGDFYAKACATRCRVLVKSIRSTFPLFANLLENNFLCKIKAYINAQIIRLSEFVQKHIGAFH